ncbi:RNA polymerase sigma factor RpoE [Labilithrix luteola]|uniref:RNA polymerase sigma factor RpoE n=1 Tax=Labilithrix luteola TaxID=1391654 RepID=A0A0K1Q6Z4_9BACT|nr:sigma-70 family RNA polymerase sigma factor [Labilithrix luteola]AKV01601.1 RNA polymerase sigma factor RpoE [Labilithrix luteola]
MAHRFPRLISEDDAADLVSTVYELLLAGDMRRLRTFDASRGSALSAWLRTIAVNAVYDHLRSVRRSPEMTGLDDALELVSPAPDPFEATFEHERRVLAIRLFDELSEKDQSFVVLYFGAELEPPAIASKLSISVNTVYSKKHKIQGRFESLLRLVTDREMDARTLAA